MYYRIVSENTAPYSTHVYDEHGNEVHGVVACMVYPFDAQSKTIQAELTILVQHIDVIAECSIVAACPACGYKEPLTTETFDDEQSLTHHTHPYRMVKPKRTTDEGGYLKEYPIQSADAFSRQELPNPNHSTSYLKGGITLPDGSYQGSSGIIFPSGSHTFQDDPQFGRVIFDHTQDAFNPDARPSDGRVPLSKDAWEKQLGVDGIPIQSKDEAAMDWEQLVTKKYTEYLECFKEQFYKTIMGQE